MGSSIQEMFNKFKSLLADDLVFYTILIVLVALTAFGLGRWSVSQHPQQVPIIVKNETLGASATPLSATSTIRSEVKSSSTSSKVTKETALYVGSKNSTKYHLLTCPGAKQISEENKVYFSSKEDALKQGYSPASNCKGL